MKILSRTLVAITLIAAVTAPVLAGERLRQPRPIQPGMTFTKVEGQSTVAGLGIGTPRGLAMFDAWMTSDLMISDYETESLWFDTELVKVVANIYTAKARRTLGSLIVKNAAGQTIVNVSDEGVTEPDTLYIITAQLTEPLPVGYYKAIVKYRQGDATVGQQFWFAVIPTPTQAE